MHDKLFFFFDSEWVRIALPIVTATTVPTPAFRELRLAATAAGRRGHGDRLHLSAARRNWSPFYQKMFALYGNTARNAAGRSGLPVQQQRKRGARGAPPDGNGCANRQSVSHSSDDHEQVQTARIDYNIDPNNITWFRFQADTGLQAAYTDPINPLFNALSPQPLYSFAAGYTHIFLRAW